MSELHRIALGLIEDLNAGALYGEQLARPDGKVNWPKIDAAWDLLSTGEQVAIGAAAVITRDGPWRMQQAATIPDLVSKVDEETRTRILDALQASAHVRT